MKKGLKYGLIGGLLIIIIGIILIISSQNFPRPSRSLLIAGSILLMILGTILDLIILGIIFIFKKNSVEPTKTSNKNIAQVNQSKIKNNFFTVLKGFGASFLIYLGAYIASYIVVFILTIIFAKILFWYVGDFNESIPNYILQLILFIIFNQIILKKSDNLPFKKGVTIGFYVFIIIMVIGIISLFI